MRYYIEPAEQDEEVKQKLEEIRYKNVNLEEITIIDPCVGSGHILFMHLICYIKCMKKLDIQVVTYHN